jgi:hypothetical protein
MSNGSGTGVGRIFAQAGKLYESAGALALAGILYDQE